MIPPKGQQSPKFFAASTNYILPTEVFLLKCFLLELLQECEKALLENAPWKQSNIRYSFEALVKTVGIFIVDVT